MLRSRHRGRRLARLGTVVLATVVAVALAGCGMVPPGGGLVGSVPSRTASLPPVVRAVLAGGDPSGAPGRKLELVRYTIQPGTRLAMHRHPGMQLAYVESGTLTYTVVQGSVTVHQSDGGSRTIAAGQMGRIVPGEWIAEHEGVVHFGENAGPEVVEILASSLLEADQPPAVPVASGSPSPS